MAVNYSTNDRNMCLVIGILVRYLQRLHCTNHTTHCHEYVLVDKFNEATFVIIGIAAAVDNSHLLYECTFTRLTSTCTQPQ